MGRVALVTGGSRGIGAAISTRLAAAGFRVATCSVGGGEASPALIGAGVRCYQWDVADFDACEAGARQVEADVGPIDVLVNNAGITRDATLMRMTADQWRQVMDVNIGGMFNMAKAVFPGMRMRNYGRIVNISSINGQAGQIGQVNYSASKSAVRGFTKALAQESARYGITVNEVAPGYTETDMVAAVPRDILDGIVAKIPVGRLGRPEEIARAVHFLVEEDAGFITGSVISVNGGHHMY